MSETQWKARLPRAPDDALIARLRAGDVAAFRTIYEVHRARIHSFLLRLTRDQTLSRDLSQETWLRLAANARRLAPSTDVAAWLFTVARNLFVSHRRWALLNRERLFALAFLPRSETTPSPLEALCASEDEARLEIAVGRLPISQREVLLLVSVEGFEPSEVARMLGLPAETVRQRLSRARASLKRALDIGTVPEERR